jgi:hypothetical protein
MFKLTNNPSSLFLNDGHIGISSTFGRLINFAYLLAGEDKSQIFNCKSVFFCNRLGFEVNRNESGCFNFGVGEESVQENFK